LEEISAKIDPMEQYRQIVKNHREEVEKGKGARNNAQKKSKRR